MAEAAPAALSSGLYDEVRYIIKETDFPNSNLALLFLKYGLFITNIYIYKEASGDLKVFHENEGINYLLLVVAIPSLCKATLSLFIYGSSFQ